MIHNAWPVNFNHALRSFEPQALRSTHTLLSLAATSPLSPKPRVTFISSIAAALRGTPSHAIPEKLVPWRAVEAMGYAQSKWVAERICEAAAEKVVGARVSVVRVGQVCGDTVHGMWNASEAVPTTVRAALTVGALPVVEGGEEEVGWLPVDLTARAVVELAVGEGARDEVDGQGMEVFHAENLKRVRWNADFLPALKRCGLQFEAVPQREWVRRLEASEQDAEKNPPIRLLDFFRKRYGLVKDEPHPVFDTTRARELAPSLRDGTTVDEKLVGKMLKYWMEDAWAVHLAK